MSEKTKADSDNEMYDVLHELVNKNQTFAALVKKKHVVRKPVVHKIPGYVEPLPCAIDAITVEQKISLVKYRDAWISVFASTAPTTNHLAIEKAIRNMYVEAKKSKKRLELRWFDSPMAGMEEVLRRTGQLNSRQRSKRRFSKNLNLYLQQRERATQIGKQLLSEELYRQILKSLSGAIDERVQNTPGIIADEISNRLANVDDSLRTGVYDAAMAGFFGSADAAVLGFYEYLWKVLGINELKFLNGAMTAARNCGWFWPLDNAVIMTQRPRKMLFDENSFAHCANEKAIEYRDGFGVYAWHGVRVPETAILDPDSVPWLYVLDAKDHSLKNALAEIKAHKWTGGCAGCEESDEYRAALTAIRLGGIPALMDMIK